jgi:integral membrane protein
MELSLTTVKPGAHEREMNHTDSDEIDSSKRPMDSLVKLRWLRSLGKIEGISYLLLLGIAMPLKYFADLPMAVKVVGWAHGILFVALCVVLFQVWRDRNWAWKRASMVFVAALLPFGPFVIDERLKAEEDASAG